MPWEPSATSLERVTARSEKNEKRRPGGAPPVGGELSATRCTLRGPLVLALVTLPDSANILSSYVREDIFSWFGPRNLCLLFQAAILTLRSHSIALGHLPIVHSSPMNKAEQSDQQKEK